MTRHQKTLADKQGNLDGLEFERIPVRTQPLQQNEHMVIEEFDLGLVPRALCIVNRQGVQAEMFDQRMAFDFRLVIKKVSPQDGVGLLLPDRQQFLVPADDLLRGRLVQQCADHAVSRDGWS